MPKEKPIVFVFYQPNPDDKWSLAVEPESGEGKWKKRQTVVFANRAAAPIEVYIPTPLGVQGVNENWQTVEVGDENPVDIEPEFVGTFMCRAKIIAQRCPTCDSDLTKKPVVRIRPNRAGCADAECASGAAHLESAYYGLKDDSEADADPIIKINP
jgi:hypothetical protein